MSRSSKLMNNQQIKSRFTFLRTAISLLLALVIAFILILIVSDNPFNDMANLLVGPLTNVGRLTNMINKWIPFLFTGTAVCLIFSCGEVNLSVEGAFFAGAFVSTVVALIDGIPPVLHFVLSALAGGIAGAIIVGIPAIMSIKFNVLTVVSSIMINYVSLYLGLFVILNLVKDPSAGYDASYKFKETAKLHEIIPGTKIHSGIIIAILVVIIGYYLLHKTTFGLKIRTVGQNYNFAKFSGMPVAATLATTQLLGGFIAGVGGSTEVLGVYNRFSYTGLTGHGWDGIMLAVIARNNPKHIPLAALFLAYLRTSADVLNRTSNVPTEVINIVQAVIITFIAAERFLSGWEHRAIVKNSQKMLAIKEEERNE